MQLSLLRFSFIKLHLTINNNGQVQLGDFARNYFSANIILCSTVSENWFFVIGCGGK